MKVAIVGPGFPPTVGGVETHVGNIAKALASRGVQVEAWVHTQGSRIQNTTVVDGVVVRRFPVRGIGPFDASFSLFGHVRRHAVDVDLVHVHSFHSAASAAALLVPPSRPVVFTPHFHGTGHTAAARLLHVPYKPVGNRVFERADRVICVSDAERALLGTFHPYVTKRASTVLNAVDVDAIHTARPYTRVSPTVLVLGRLEQYKKVGTIIRAFCAQAAAGQLVVIGDGPDRPRLERMAAQTPRAAEIRFLGRLSRDEVDRWLRTARCVVSMSEHEAFGIVALEAVAAGATALVSDLPAHREVVELVGGVGVTIVTEMELPHRISTALAAARGDARHLRSWSDAATETREIYESALRLRRPSHHRT